MFQTLGLSESRALYFYNTYTGVLSSEGCVGKALLSNNEDDFRKFVEHITSIVPFTTILGYGNPLEAAIHLYDSLWSDDRERVIHWGILKTLAGLLATDQDKKDWLRKQIEHEFYVHPKLSSEDVEILTNIVLKMNLDNHFFPTYFHVPSGMDNVGEMVTIIERFEEPFDFIQFALSVMRREDNVLPTLEKMCSQWRLVFNTWEEFDQVNQFSSMETLLEYILEYVHQEDERQLYPSE